MDAGTVLYCLANGRRSYYGVADNMRRRLRQHNGEIKKGARATRMMRTITGQPSHVAILVSGWPSRNEALKLEWRLHDGVKCPLGKTKNPFGSSAVAVAVARRAQQLHWAFKMVQFTKSATPVAQLPPLCIHWRDEELYKIATDPERTMWPPQVTHCILD
jgi:structure-specific endonuclease subunit SLX1